jgi:ribosomal-protein-alanine N-acetyltransferase
MAGRHRVRHDGGVPDDVPPVPRLRTDRLLLREFLPADRGPFAAVNADREVAATLSRALTREESDAYIDRIAARWREDAFGMWALQRLDDGTFIGCAGLSVPSWSPVPGIEIGWRLARPSWGFGYATEAARAAVGWAFEALAIEELISLTGAVNMRSRAVMERLGMRHDGASDFAHPRLPPDHPLSAHVAYRLSRDGWRASR